MPEKRIETQSSQTAAWVCFCRAVSALERNPYYHSDDHLAPVLLPTFLRRLIRIPYAGRLMLRIFAARGIYEYVIARTKYIDAAFRQALENRFSQILLFGAGFDTRALRFQGEAGETRIFELDVSTTQEAKIGQYRKRQLSIPANAVFVPIDFDRESLPEKLDQAGFRRGERSLFILEGVLEYLQPESVDQTFRTIRELAGVGSEVVFNYIHGSVIRGEGRYYGEKGAVKTMAGAGEAWCFGIDEGEIGSFLSRYGFELLDHRDARELEELYFKNEAGRIVSRMTGTQCLVRAVRARA